MRRVGSFFVLCAKLQFCEKNHFYLHNSKKSCTFAAAKVKSHIRYTMDTPKQKKDMPFASENNAGGLQKQYFTADEAMAFLEPRIRAMFK